MREPLKLGAILLVITTICAGLLGFINNLTPPVIKLGRQETQNQAVKKLLPDVETVKEIEVTDQDKITTAFITYKGSDYTGSVIKVYPEGYGGSIELLVGILPEGKVAGIQVLSHQETPGLGANMDKEDFKAQFPGKQTPIVVNKMNPSENEIMAITGATITSKGVADGVNLAAEYVQSHQEEWQKGDAQ